MVRRSLARLVSLASTLRLWSATRRARRHTAVFFTLPDREIRRLDVALGPCVPPPGRSRPLVGPFRQTLGTAEEMEALFRVLAPHATGAAWATTRREGRGRLCVFSDAFVEPLAAFSGEFQGTDNQIPHEDRWARLQEMATPWVAVRGRPRNGQREHLDIAEAAWWARLAQDRGQALYAWFGPGVPLTYSIVKRIRRRE